MFGQFEGWQLHPAVKGHGYAMLRFAPYGTELRSTNAWARFRPYSQVGVAKSSRTRWNNTNLPVVYNAHEAGQVKGYPQTPDIRGTRVPENHI